MPTTSKCPSCGATAEKQLFKENDWVCYHPYHGDITRFWRFTDLFLKEYMEMRAKQYPNS